MRTARQAGLRPATPAGRFNGALSSVQSLFCCRSATAHRHRQQCSHQHLDLEVLGPWTRARPGRTAWRGCHRGARAGEHCRWSSRGPAQLTMRRTYQRSGSPSWTSGWQVCTCPRIFHVRRCSWYNGLQLTAVIQANTTPSAPCFPHSMQHLPHFEALLPCKVQSLHMHWQQQPSRDSSLPPPSIPVGRYLILGQCARIAAPTW